MLFTFNLVDLRVVTIKVKPWICAKEVCKALEYNKKTGYYKGTLSPRKL